MNKGQYFRNWKKTVLTITNILIFIISCAIVSSTGLRPAFTLLVVPAPSFFHIHMTDFLQCGLGLYVSGVAIHGDSGSSSWSCANSA
jgi:polyferredoxin